MTENACDPPAADLRSKLGADPGLCWTCHHSRFNQTRRGTAYVRCTRAAWDERMARYPRLPVVVCAGYEERPAP